MPTKTAPWEKTLRSNIKRDYGKGWGLRSMNGGTQLTRRWPEGGQSNGQLDIPWRSDHAFTIETAVRRAIDRIKAGEPVNAACTAVAGKDVTPDGINWQQILERFCAHLADRRASTMADKLSHVRKAIELLENGHPRPQDTGSLLRAYAAKHFAQCPPGGEGRKHHLKSVQQFLIFAASHCKTPERFAPADRDTVRALIGSRPVSTSENLTSPVQPGQLAALLDGIEAEGNTELWMLVALIGCYGLRPAEIATLHLVGDKLMVGPVKRNIHSMDATQKPRLVLPLEIPGRDDGARAKQLFASGLVKLPKLVATSITRLNAGNAGFKEVGRCVRNLLQRNKSWLALREVNPEIVPYSLRHGWAWRAHKAYDRPLSTRDAAALMGHSPAVHHQHYGRWIDEEGLVEAVAKLTATPLQADALGC